MAKEEHISYFRDMLKRLAAVKMFVGLFLATALIWAQVAKAQINYSVSLPLKARQLTGLKVENSDGQKVGIVRNLVIDIKTGRLRYVVIGSDGFLGVRASLKVAPSRAISTATTKRQTLAVNATTTQWNHAPVFKSSDLVSLGDPKHAREISRDFEMSPTGVSVAASNLISFTGRESAPNSPVPELKFASDLIGMRVVNQNQEKIGEVMDLLVSFGEPRSAFAIISSGRFFHHEHAYAVPLSALSSSPGESKLMLNANTATLQQPRPFDQHIWEASTGISSNQIYSYSMP
jgi:sporulation protein YlmC with PRC-barrel domain